MKKIICLIMTLTTFHKIISNNHSQSSDKYNDVSTFIDKKIDTQAINDRITMLETENEKLLAVIVQLQINLAKMRINGGAQGNIKPKLQKAAQKIIADIQNKNQKIAQNKAAIQALILSDPNRKLDTPIYAKPIQYYQQSEIKSQDKKKNKN